MTRRPTVKLWEHAGLGLIVEYHSGIVYSNQTCGNLCRQSELEGVFIPLRNHVTPGGRLLSPESELLAYFTQPSTGKLGVDGLDAEEVAFIESVLDKYNLSDLISIDRSRLAESHEAWVYVKLAGEQDTDVPLYSGLGPYPRSGVLTWTNGD